MRATRRASAARAFRRRMAQAILKLGLFLSAVGVAAGGLRLIFTTSHVLVEGTRLVRPAEVLRYSRLIPFQPLPAAGARRVASDVELHPWVASAVVRMRWPRGVAVTVHEEEPAYRMRFEEGAPLWVSRRCRLLDPRGRPGRLVELELSSGTQEMQLGGRLPAPVCDFATALQGSSLFPRARRAVVVEGSRVSLFMADGLEIRMGTMNDLTKKLAVAAALLSAPERQAVPLEYLDVQEPDYPAAKPK